MTQTDNWTKHFSSVKTLDQGMKSGAVGLICCLGEYSTHPEVLFYRELHSTLTGQSSGRVVLFIGED